VLNAAQAAPMIRTACGPHSGVAKSITPSWERNAAFPSAPKCAVRLTRGIWRATSFPAGITRSVMPSRVAMACPIEAAWL